MACYDYEYLVRYDEGDLSGAKEKAVRDHLEQCTRCQEKLESAHDTWTSLNMLETVTLRSDFEEGVQQKITRSKPVERHARMYQAGIALAAAALLLVFGLAFILSGNKASQDQDDSQESIAQDESNQDQDQNQDTDVDTGRDVNIDADFASVAPESLEWTKEDDLALLDDPRVQEQLVMIDEVSYIHKTELKALLQEVNDDLELFSILMDK